MKDDRKPKEEHHLDGEEQVCSEGGGGKSLMLSRRQALFAGALAGASLAFPWKHLTPPVLAQTPRGQRYHESFWNALQVSPVLTKYVTRLKFPTTATPTVLPKDPGSDRYDFRLEVFKDKLHPTLPATTLFGYAAAGLPPEYPGPTIVALRGRRVLLNVTNNLTGPYPLPVDQTIANVSGFVKNNPPFAVHLHGGNIPAEFDGGPLDRFAPGSSYTYEYPNLQEGATLWYHDHALGVTRLNVILGLAGFYPIVDETVEPQLGLPSGIGQFDYPLAIQDRIFQANGNFFYPNVWTPEYFGDVALVNGRVWPLADAQRGWYRLRFLNGCNARFLRLKLSPAPPAAAGPVMWYIASDSGYLPRAVPVRGAGLLIAPGERYEVVVNFGAYNAGDRVTLVNDAPIPFPTPVPGLPALPEIMQFRILKGVGPTFDPTTFAPPVPPRLAPAQAARTRYLTLVERFDAAGNVKKILINNNDFLDPVTEDPRAGDVEVWNFINDSADAHPLHLHQVAFNVLGRQNFDAVGYRAANPSMRAGVPVEPFLIPGTFTGPRNYEVGWKDTVVCPPGQVTQIIMQWGPYKGNYVYHCHILDHEDNEMMRQMIVR